MDYKGATDKCDYKKLQNEWHFWYKVSGNAGNALAAVEVPKQRRCGTKDRVYLTSSHPLLSDGQVTRWVCMATQNSNCAQKDKIQVINCGAFYLYKLVEMKRTCSPRAWRYCTQGEPGESNRVVNHFVPEIAHG